MSSNAARGALIGALAVGLSYLLVRLVVHHWQALLAFCAVLWVLSQCSSGSDQTASEARSVAGKIAIRDVTANSSPYSRWVNSVTTTVVNASPARIYDLRLRCQFHRTGDPEQQNRITSFYHLGYIRPGAKERMTFNFGVDGSLLEADPASFSCEPWYEVEQPDLLRATNQRHRDLRAQIEEALTSTTIRSHARFDRVAVLVEGHVTNASPWPVAGATISCRVMKDESGNTEVLSRTLPVNADPGETVALSGQVGEVKPLDPKRGLLGHHCRLAGVRRSQS